jgi:hypothetical protein
MLASAFPPFRRGFQATFRATPDPANPAPPRAKQLRPNCPQGTGRRISPRCLILLYDTPIILCPGPPARPMGPKPPVGGAPPAPVPRPGQWDPEPALGLAIGPAAPRRGVWAGRSGGGLRRERGLPLARAGGRRSPGRGLFGRGQLAESAGEAVPPGSPSTFTNVQPYPRLIWERICG